MPTNSTSYNQDIGELLSFRARVLREPTVLFPAVSSLLERIENLVDRGVVGTRAECFPVVGPSGVGKSHALRYIESRYQNGEVKRSSTVNKDNFGLMRTAEVLFVETPSPASRKGLIDAMLAALDPQTISTRMTLAEQRSRLAAYLKKANVRLIIIDEFQHLIHAKNQKIVSEVADLVKSLLNEKICPIVLAGTEGVLTIMEETNQLRTRMYSREVLRPFSWHKPEEQEVFRQYLFEMENALEFEEPSDLGEERRAYKIYFATRGLVGETARLLDRAAEIATRAGLSSITDECLAIAIDRAWILDDKIPCNPFRVEKLPPLTQ